ncbi:fatty acid desaturase-domain-containing protein, partial [Blastocladiella britannica]
MKPTISDEERAAIMANVSAYNTPSTARAVWELAVTLVPFALLHWFAFWPTLPLAVLLRVRAFILSHDAAHGALFPSRTANRWTANLVMPAAAYTPASFWRSTHTYHHAHANELGAHDTPWTTAQYVASPRRARALYRLLNHPFTMLSGLLPAAMYFGIQQWAARHWYEWAIEVIVLWLHARRGTLAFELVSALLGAMVGMLLFNVQHSFHGVHRARREEWDSIAVALYGSSLLVLPRALAWFTAGLEYHHVHHLDTRVPCYRLRECHDAAADSLFRNVCRVPLSAMVTVLGYSLWDEGLCKMVTPSEVEGRSSIEKTTT